VHTGDVLLGILSKVKPEWVSTSASDNSQSNMGILFPRKWISNDIPGDGINGGLRLVNDGIFRYVGVIHFFKCNPFAVWRPPKAMTASHFLLGYVFCQSMGSSLQIGAFGQLGRLSSRYGNDMKFVVLNISNPVIVWRNLGIQNRKLASIHKLAKGLIGVIQDKDGPQQW